MTKVPVNTIEQMISELESESYHEDCYGERYPSSTMVVNLEDAIKVIRKYAKEQTDD